MADPLSLVALGAVVGGAAGKFTEKAYDSLSIWLGGYFLNHQPKAQEKAKENGLDFLVELAQRVKDIEENNRISKEKIEKAQEDPNFSASLQSAIISAAQTDDKNKHKLLAVTLSERLCAEPESLLALTSKMALDVISLATPNQLNILAFSFEMFHIKPSFPINTHEYTLWLRERFKPYKNVEISNFDLLHLESLSCIKINNLIQRNINETLNLKNEGRGFDLKFLEQNIGKKINELWINKIEQVNLTSVGYLLGMHIVSLKNSTNFSLDDFK